MLSHSTIWSALFASFSLATSCHPSQIMTGKSSWAQRTITVTASSRGCHLITREIERQVPELREFKVGMANIFLKHTSASITLNENVRNCTSHAFKPPSVWTVRSEGVLPFSSPPVLAFNFLREMVAAPPKLAEFYVSVTSHIHAINL